MGLMGLVAVGMTTLLTTVMKSQRSLQAKDQQRELTSELRNLLNNKTACTNSFGGQNPQLGFTVLNIKDAAGTVKYSVNTNDKSGLLMFNEFKMTSWVADAGFTTQGNAELKVKLIKTGETLGVKDIKPDIITLKVKRDAAGNVIECFSIGVAGDGFWQPSPMNISNINYMGGNVGIGTQAPTAKLNVAGEIQISNTGIGCSAANEGAQRYNSVLKTMEFCNGTSWGSVSGSAGFTVFSGANPTCPVGKTAYFKNWTAKTCGVGGCQPLSCTTGGWGAAGVKSPTCTFRNGGAQMNSYCALGTWGICDSTTWSQVLCL